LSVEIGGSTDVATERVFSLLLSLYRVLVIRGSTVLVSGKSGAATVNGVVVGMVMLVGMFTVLSYGVGLGSSVEFRCVCKLMYAVSCCDADASSTMGLGSVVVGGSAIDGSSPRKR
jgi:hypothetical protein